MIEMLQVNYNYRNEYESKYRKVLYFISNLLTEFVNGLSTPNKYN
jgi:hypothetical protein